MNAFNIKRYLEVGSSVAVILVAIALLSVFGRFLFNRSPKVLVETGLHRGQEFTAVPEADGDILVVALNTTCGYCKESIPFYNQLNQLQGSMGKPIHIVAVFPNSEKDVKKYVQLVGLSTSTIANTNFEKIHVLGTPTIILVNHKRIIRDFWIGKLSQDEAQQVIKAVGLNSL